MSNHMTKSQVKALPSSKKGLRDGFPMQDKKHQRLAIGGATRSYHAGNIGRSTMERIQSEARGKLKSGRGG